MGWGSGSGGGAPEGVLAKKSGGGGGGLFGLGVGPNWGLSQIWHGAEFPFKAAGGLATGVDNFAMNEGAAAGSALSAGAWRLRGAVGETPEAEAEARAHQSLTRAGQFESNAGAMPVSLVQGLGQGVSNLADIPAIIPGVNGYGQAVNRATGVGLAEIGALGQHSSHGQIAGAAQSLAPPSFEQASQQEGGALNPLLNTVGVLSLAGGAAERGGGMAADAFDSAGHPAAAAAASRVADAGATLKHPLQGVFQNTLGAIGQAAHAARNAAVADLNPEMRGYYDQAGKDLGMRPPTQVIDTSRTNTEATGGPMAAEYASKPANPSDLTPDEYAQAKAAYDKLNTEVAAQHEYLTRPVEQGGMGVSVTPVDRAVNPYTNPETGATDYAKMHQDITQNKHLFVDNTTPDESHPFMSPEQNGKFRAVHDVFGHSIAGNGFEPNGEEVAFQHHAAMFSPDAQRALAMETRLQNSALNYSPENLARAAAGEGKQFDVQRAGVASPESANPELTRVPQPVEDKSPTAKDEAQRAAGGPKPWAERVVGKLPGGPEGTATRALAAIEGVHAYRAFQNIRRELGRYRGAEDRGTINEPFIKASTAAEDLIRAKDKSLSRAAASKLIGDELAARLQHLNGEAGYFGPEIARAQEMGLGGAAEKLRAAGRQTTGIEPRLQSPELEKALQTALKEYPKFLSKIQQGYLDSSRLGARGLERIEAENPEWSKSQKLLQRRIDTMTARAARLRERVPVEVERLQAQLDASRAREGRIAGGVETAQEAQQTAAERLDALRQHVEPTDEGAPGKTAKQMVRATPAAPNPEVEAAKGAQRTLENRSGQLPMAREVRGAQSVEGNDMRVERQQVNQGIAATKETIKNASAQETPNAALRRGVDLAYSARDISAASDKIATRMKSLAEQQSVSAELDRRIAEADTPAARKAAQADRIAAKSQERLSKSLANTEPSRWPRAAKPIGYAYQDLLTQAERDPELRAVLGEAKPTWQAFVARSAQLGLDPQYVADIRPERVAKLLRDPGKLDITKVDISGARKEFTGQLARTGTVDRSVEAFAAAMNEMHDEMARNIGVDYFEKNYAIPVRPETHVSPIMWAEWDPAKQWLLHGTDEAGKLVTKPGTRYIIPRALDTAIQMDRLGPALTQTWPMRALNKATNVFRTAVITASPAFYLSHITSRAILATIEGVNLGEWGKAINLWRQAGEGNAYDMLAGHSITTEIKGGPPVIGDVEGMRARASQAIAAAKAEGDGAFAQAKAGFGGGIHGAASTLHNIVNTADSIARTAVYLHDLAKGGDEIHALNIAHAALVDYGDLSGFEQSAVRAIVPFYSYMKGIIKIAMKLPVDHPVALAVGAQMHRLTEQLQKDAWGTALTSGYAGVVPMNGAGVDMNKINPFKDAERLATPDGIASALNPFLGEIVRYAFHAPYGGYTRTYTVDPYGNKVPDMTGAQIAQDLYGGVPGVQEGEAIAGAGTTGAGQATGRFFGFNVRDAAKMQALAAKIAGSRAAAASGSPFAPRTPSGTGRSKKHGWGS